MYSAPHKESLPSRSKMRQRGTCLDQQISKQERWLISYTISELQTIVQQFLRLQHSELFWVVFRLIDVVAHLRYGIECIVQSCMRDGIVARWRKFTQVFEQELVASNSLDWLDCQLTANINMWSLLTLISRSFNPNAFLRDAIRLLSGFIDD